MFLRIYLLKGKTVRKFGMKVCSTMLCLAMMVGMLPISATTGPNVKDKDQSTNTSVQTAPQDEPSAAADESPAAEIIRDGSTTTYTTLAAAFASVKDDETSTITMLRDEELAHAKSGIEYSSYGNITLELNDKVVSFNGSVSSSVAINFKPGSLIGKTASLTIINSGDEHRGEIIVREGNSFGSAVIASSGYNVTIGGTAKISMTGTKSGSQKGFYGTSLTLQDNAVISTTVGSGGSYGAGSGAVHLFSADCKLTLKDNALILSNDIAIYAGHSRQTIKFEGGMIAGLCSGAWFDANPSDYAHWRVFGDVSLFVPVQVSAGGPVRELIITTGAKLTTNGLLTNPSGSKITVYGTLEGEVLGDGEVNHYPTAELSFSTWQNGNQISAGPNQKVTLRVTFRDPNAPAQNAALRSAIPMETKNVADIYQINGEEKIKLNTSQLPVVRDTDGSYYAEVNWTTPASGSTDFLVEYGVLTDGTAAGGLAPGSAKGSFKLRGVAEIDGVEYDTLQDALDSAAGTEFWTKVAKITLLRDIDLGTEGVTYKGDNDVILELNDKKISSFLGNHTGVINIEGGEFTITNSGSAGTGEIISTGPKVSHAVFHSGAIVYLTGTAKITAKGTGGAIKGQHMEATGSVVISNTHEDGTGINVLPNGKLKLGGNVQVQGTTAILANTAEKLEINSGVLLGGCDGDYFTEDNNLQWTAVGEVSLSASTSIPAGKTLKIPANSTLTVPTGIVLNNEGTVEVYGTLKQGGILGIVTGKIVYFGNTISIWKDGKRANHAVPGKPITLRASIAQAASTGTQTITGNVGFYLGKDNTTPIQTITDIKSEKGFLVAEIEWTPKDVNTSQDIFVSFSGITINGAPVPDSTITSTVAVRGAATTGGKDYATLQAAFAAAKSDATVQVLGDISLDAGIIYKAGNITLDLNGYAINAAENMTGDAMLKKTDEGKINIIDASLAGGGSISAGAVNAGVINAARGVSVRGKISLNAGGNVPAITAQNVEVRDSARVVATGSASAIALPKSGNLIVRNKALVRSGAAVTVSSKENPVIVLEGDSIIMGAGAALDFAENSTASLQIENSVLWGDCLGTYFEKNPNIAWSVKGNVTLGVDAEVPSGRTLTIPKGSSLTIDAGKTLTNIGPIANQGTLNHSGAFGEVSDITNIHTPSEAKDKGLTEEKDGNKQTDIFNGQEVVLKLFVQAEASENTHTNSLAVDEASENTASFYWTDSKGANHLINTNAAPMKPDGNGGWTAEAKWQPSEMADSQTIIASYGELSGNGADQLVQAGVVQTSIKVKGQAEITTNGASIIYSTVQAAFSKVKAGEVVKLLCDVDLGMAWLNVGYNDGHESTLDLNDKILSSWNTSALILLHSSYAKDFTITNTGPLARGELIGHSTVVNGGGGAVNLVVSGSAKISGRNAESLIEAKNIIIKDNAVLDATAENENTQTKAVVFASSAIDNSASIVVQDNAVIKGAKGTAFSMRASSNPDGRPMNITIKGNAVVSSSKEIVNLPSGAGHNFAFTGGMLLGDCKGDYFSAETNPQWTMKSSARLPLSETIPQGKKLTIPAGMQLKVNDGATLTINGDLYSNGTLIGKTDGTGTHHFTSKMWIEMLDAQGNPGALRYGADTTIRVTPAPSSSTARPESGTNSGLNLGADRGEVKVYLGTDNNGKLLGTAKVEDVVGGSPCATVKGVNLHGAGFEVGTKQNIFVEYSGSSAAGLTENPTTGLLAGTSSQEFTLERGAIVVTPEAGQKKYFGQQEPTLKYTVAGNAEGDAITISGDLTRISGETVGTYKIEGTNLSIDGAAKEKYETTPIVMEETFAIEEYSPSETASVADAAKGENGWYKGDESGVVSINAPENFSISSTLEGTFGRNITASADGANLAISYYLKNTKTDAPEFGAVSTEKTLTTLNIDRTAPTKPAATATNVGDKYATITAEATDEVSGVAQYTLTYNGKTQTSTTGVFNLTNLSSDTEYVAAVIAKDEAGNSSNASNEVEFKTEKTIPTIKTEPTMSAVYGTAVDAMPIIGGSVFDGETEVAGAWGFLGTDGAETPAVGSTKQYEITFTPTSQAYKSISVSITPVVTPAPLTVASYTPDNKAYDGNNTANISAVEFSGMVLGQTFTSDDYTVSNATFASKNANNALQVTGTVSLNPSSATAKNYSLETGTLAGKSAAITAVTLVITGGRVESKPWDGEASATITTISFSGLVNGETIAIGADYAVADAAYADSDAGVGKPIAKGTVSLKTTDVAANYVLANGNLAGNGITGTISKKTGISAPKFAAMDDENNTFEFTPISGFDAKELYEYKLESESTWTQVATNPIQVGNRAGAIQVRLKDTKNNEVGATYTHKTPFTAAITGSVTIEGAAIYGETLTAKVVGQQNGAQLSYQWKADGAVIGAGQTQSVRGTDVGKIITVTVTATDYKGELVSANSAKVAPKTVTASVTNNIIKTYDGSNRAVASLEITKVSSADNITIKAPNATYNNKNAGKNKAITLGELTIEGEAKNYYKVVAPNNITGEITQKNLTWQANGTANNKDYDGNATATVKTAPILGGVVDLDTVMVKEGTLAFASAQAGTHVITATGFGIEGVDAANYIVPAPQPYFATAEIMPKDIAPVITISGTYVFDGEQKIPTFSVAGDGKTLTTGDYTATYGANISVKTGGSVSITLRGNYKGSATANFNISKATTQNIENPKPILMTEKTVKSYSIPLPAGIGNAGEAVYSVGAPTEGAAIFSQVPRINAQAKTLEFASAATAAIGMSAKVVITISSENYKDFNVTLSFGLTEKENLIITGLATEENLIYNANPQKGYVGTLMINGHAATGEEMKILRFEYDGINGTTYNSTDAPTNAGSYKLVVSVDESNPDTQAAM